MSLTQRLFDPASAFDHSLTVGITIFVVAALVVTPLVLVTLNRAGKLSEHHRIELYARYKGWLILAPLMIGPVLLGPGCTILAVFVLSILGYREFARATGFFRERVLSFVVVIGIALLTFAALDHWYMFFVAIPSLTIIAIAMFALLRDQPSGYLQRVAIAVFCFLLFGFCFGHLGFMANDRDYRPIVLMIVICVELNDVFAYVCGKLFGRTPLAPNTSPNKTNEGAFGAIVLTTLLFMALGRLIFAGHVLGTWPHLATMGFLLGISGLFGDLLMSAIKRDLGVKDMAATIPGHGGLLDRFDSLILAAPALFHYINYFRGFGPDLPTRIFSLPH